ncbi:NUDIX domain-containing protein [Spongisporangium articulatum]|uniref:NUDIX domain-containing protein n=1 Tax=Spongisporangium articulatum TaxID=3362603 RepID=A0ABW8AGE9_9ACTN
MTTGYDPRAFPPFAVTVDLALFTIRNGVFTVLLVERGGEPFAGAWALPGGFLLESEDAATAARRELAEETGVDVAAAGVHLEQLGTYSAPDRDPRMRVVSVAHVALAPDLPEPQAGTDAARARWWPVGELAPGRSDQGPQLAFDHALILADAVDRVAAKLEYSTLATRFVPPTFTLGELQAVYEAVWAVPLDRANFRRKVLSADDMVRPDGGDPRLTAGRGRPAALYRAGRATTLNPPLLRPAP